MNICFNKELISFIRIDESKKTDKERLKLHGEILTIKFRKYNVKSEFNEIIKIEQNGNMTFYKFNKYGNIIEGIEFEKSEKFRSFNVYEYDEHNNLINKYDNIKKDYNSLIYEFNNIRTKTQKTKEFLFKSYSYDKNNNVTNEYRQDSKNGEKYESKILIYNKNL